MENEVYTISKKVLEEIKIELLFAKQRGADVRDSLELINELISKCSDNLFRFV